MEVIGKEFIRDELVYIPARMFVRKHYVETVRCVSCGIDKIRDNEREEDIPNQVIVKAAALILGSFCSSELLGTYSVFKTCSYSTSLPSGKGLYGMRCKAQQTDYASSDTKLSKAVSYAINEKKYLYRFLESPYISTDNNRAENAIRPFVVGRTNWLFSNTQNSARASALIYSLAVIACTNGLNVEDYFYRLLTSDVPVIPWNG